MSVTDLGHTRFAYSPLAEAGESLHMIVSSRVRHPYVGWFDAVRSELRRVDMALLAAVVPARPVIADFLFDGASDPGTTIDNQLELVRSMSHAALERELREVWCGDAMPPLARELCTPGAGGPARLADALWSYWSVAMEPFWRTMRGVFDDDVAYRAGALTKGGVRAMLTELHPDLSVQNDFLRIDKKPQLPAGLEPLSGSGMLLVPSVFVWPNLIFATSMAGPPSLTYPARGIGNIWGRSDVVDEGALGALLGRARAEILIALSLPLSTTELAFMLRQTASSVSQHLSVLRRAALVTSWRSGRCVLYRRTDLADSIVDANCSSPTTSANGRSSLQLVTAAT